MTCHTNPDNRRMAWNKIREATSLLDVTRRMGAFLSDDILSHYMEQANIASSRGSIGPFSYFGMYTLSYIRLNGDGFKLVLSSNLPPGDGAYTQVLCQAETESRIHIQGTKALFFADDWPFVQRQALHRFCLGNLPDTTLPGALNDLNQYALHHAHMPLANLLQLFQLDMFPNWLSFEQFLNQSQSTTSPLELPPDATLYP